MICSNPVLEFLIGDLSLSLSLSLRASLNAYELPDRVYKELVNFPFPPSNHPLFDLRHVMRLR